MEGTLRLFENNDAPTILLATSFVILAIIRQAYPRRFLDFLSLPISGKFLKVHAREDELQHPFNILFFFFQVLNVTILIFLTFSTVLNYEVGIWSFLRIATLYCVFVLGKVLIEKIIGNIFSIDIIIENYLYEKLSYRNYLSLAIFAGNLLFIYSTTPTILHIKIFVSIILLANFVIAIVLLKRNWNLLTYHFFYFILYLCALEISPYIILYYLFLSSGY